jgi:hypothetical protein
MKGGGSMQTTGVMALTLIDVNLFPAPPERPRSNRKQRRNRASKLAQAARRALTAAMQDDAEYMPRLGSYPY